MEFCLPENSNYTVSSSNQQLTWKGSSQAWKHACPSSQHCLHPCSIPSSLQGHCLASPILPTLQYRFMLSLLIFFIPDDYNFENYNLKSCSQVCVLFNQKHRPGLGEMTHLVKGLPFRHKDSCSDSSALRS